MGKRVGTNNGTTFTRVNAASVHQWTFSFDGHLSDWYGFIVDNAENYLYSIEKSINGGTPLRIFEINTADGSLFNT